MMKQILAIVLVIVLIMPGCATMQEYKKTTIGATAGTILGAGLGYAIGGGKGAAAGAVLGGLLGGGIGYMMDKQEKEFKQELARSQAQTQAAILEGVRKEQDAIILTFKSDVLFNINSATINPGAYSSGEISRVATIMNKYPDTSIQIIGYTDSTGSEAYNQQLSQQRAISVLNALAAQGVNASRMTAIGMGESNPIADNSTAEGRMLNRRVNIKIQPYQQQQQGMM
jgi:outer membrane protein OmpA-like peptidoglycan-associated protein